VENNVAEPYKPRDCYDIKQKYNLRYNGVFTVFVSALNDQNKTVEIPVVVYCDLTNDGGGWTVCIKTL